MRVLPPSTRAALSYAIERGTVYSVRREGVSVRATRRPLQWLLPVGLVMAAVIFAVGVSGSAARPEKRGNAAAHATGGGAAGGVNLHEGSALTLALSGD